MQAVFKVMLATSVFMAATAQAGVSKEQVVDQYAEVAHAVFSDALMTAQVLRKQIDVLVQQPSETAQQDARAAWKAARVPYQQSEVYRFGNPVVDDWEGQLNAWPLDEGLIDYVEPSHYHHEMGNAGANANIIANTSLKLGGDTLDLTRLTPELLADLNELAGSEANVATGYHAIEFLLWGQDLNGTGPGAGERPYTDYVTGEGCTHGHCERRGQYLQAVADLLVKDLEYMQGQWAPDGDNYRAKLQQQDPQQALTKALFGMGSLALGELAGERMKVALEANSTEDEHDCFSDNTHYSHYYNAQGIENVYYGSYQRVDGTKVSGPAMAQLVAQQDPKLAKSVDRQFDRTMANLQRMVDTAEAGSGMKFDQMIAEGNDKGAEIVHGAIDSLVALTQDIEQVATTLGVNNLAPDNADHEF
ncbi:MAG: imelysin family protein [Pseudomonadota bacterium]|nr:imelysin family protein [Pseudomonadota bacterium]